MTAPHRPIWARTPNERRLSALYPERALARGREGEARLTCIVQDGGALDCDRVSETPGGFGAAAVRVARTFRHAPQLADGSNAIGTPVNLRVVFRIDDDPRGRG
ncbi:MAG: energy transducer TonB [Hyphomonadaceae bacterium JAD_PAG50586_4]|nr:MAG: energy transducer TonB [Hyphomonadaceae bacterium JAD_PAG50586_4]